ncbi:MAG: stage II sporulation protein M, partial [Flavobacteriales bacterium]|nr:stage II sporulation protein M [Flavobacteriales bacterium]
MIAYNNIRVSLMCFALGLMLQVGSLFFILYNSIMFGSFMWMFVQKGLMKDAVLTVMMHGTIELSMIIVAGAAGVALGKGLVKPGSFSRLQAMIRSARHGTTIMVAVTAFLIVAAVIESFITRFSLTSNPDNQIYLDIFRGVFIVISLLVVLVYFVFLPLMRNRMGLVPEKMYQDNIIEQPTRLSGAVILSTKAIIHESLKRFFANLGKMVAAQAAIVVAFLVTAYQILGVEQAEIWLRLERSEFSQWVPLWVMDDVNNVFNAYGRPILLIPIIIFFGLSILCCTYFSSKASSTGLKSWNIIISNSAVTSFLLSLPFVLYSLGWSEGLELTLLIFVVPYWIIVLAIHSSAMFHGEFFFKHLTNFKGLSNRTTGRTITLFFGLALMIWLISFIVQAPIMYFLQELPALQLSPDQGWTVDVFLIIEVFTLVAWTAVLFGLFFFGFEISARINREIATADGLKEAISSIQFKRKAYGLEKEI